MTIKLQATTPDSASDSSECCRWTEIGLEAAAEWNGTLLRTDASLYQYPYWNEPYRQIGIRPTYLAWHRDEVPVAYLCLLSLGFGHLRIGLVMRGPVNLAGTPRFPDGALSALGCWGRKNGFIFIRFTHSDSGVLAALPEAGPCRNEECFPYHLDRSVSSHDLVVVQSSDDAQMLSGFDREARRKIRRASEVGYEVRIGKSAADVERLWPVFTEFFRTKGIQFNRPASRAVEAARGAEHDGCVRVYSAWIDGRPIAANLVFRDRDTALCHFAALDLEALGGRPSPSVLLHWEAMRDMYRSGTKFYNLENGSGTLMQFKQQFRPIRVEYPPPVTLVLNGPLYRLWSATALVSFRLLKPCLGWLLSCTNRAGGSASRSE